MSDTPRTNRELDENAFELSSIKLGRMIQFARTLERELNEANAKLKDMKALARQACDERYEIEQQAKNEVGRETLGSWQNMAGRLAAS